MGQKIQLARLSNFTHLEAQGRNEPFSISKDLLLGGHGPSLFGTLESTYPNPLRGFAIQRHQIINRGHRHLKHNSFCDRWCTIILFSCFLLVVFLLQNYYLLLKGHEGRVGFLVHIFPSTRFGIYLFCLFSSISKIHISLPHFLILEIKRILI